MEGDRPPPSAGFTLTQISPDTALYIGGFDPFIQECTRDIYKVQLKKNIVVRIIICPILVHFVISGCQTPK